MAIHLIGRQKEKTQLRDISESTTARFVGIWGRRRVGKTFLIDTYFQNQPSLKVVGKYKASKSDQLDLFRIALQKAFFDGASLPKFTSWAHCFEVLVACLKKHKHENFVVFLDEVPWLAGKSTNEFLGALDHSWNTELCHISHLRFIVCGSAASWMIKNFSKAKELLNLIEIFYADWPETIYFKNKIDLESSEMKEPTTVEFMNQYQNKCKNLSKTIVRKYRYDFELCLRGL